MTFANVGVFFFNRIWQGQKLVKTFLNRQKFPSHNQKFQLINKNTKSEFKYIYFKNKVTHVLDSEKSDVNEYYSSRKSPISPNA